MQEKLLRPELERMRRTKEDQTFRRSAPTGPVHYEVDDEHEGYMVGDERPAFPNEDMQRLLKPILDKMQAEDKDTS